MLQQKTNTVTQININYYALLALTNSGTAGLDNQEILWNVWAIFVWPWKMVSVNVPYLFYQPVDEKIKTWTLRFPVKEKPNMEKALFDWPVVAVWCQSEVSKVLVHEDFSPELSLNQPKATRVCILSINQPSRSISVRLLFPFCSRLFISRSYENRSKSTFKTTWCWVLFFSASDKIACITGALLAKRGKRGIFSETRNVRALRFLFAFCAKYHVRLVWLIKRLVCRLVIKQCKHNQVPETSSLS